MSPCSHVGGHNYAGNLMIYGPNANGGVTSHWYGLDMLLQMMCKFS